MTQIELVADGLYYPNNTTGHHCYSPLIEKEMRISDVRMAWGWSIMTGSLLLKVGVARFATKLQSKKVETSLLIMSILAMSAVEYAEFSAGTATIALLAVIGGIWALFNY